MGNVENQNLNVLVDLVKPSVTFPGWRYQYFRCESSKLTWSATDGLSGMALVSATLDGRPFVINTTLHMYKLSPGVHTLQVVAKDKAGNRQVAKRIFAVKSELGLSVGRPAASRVARLSYSFTGTVSPRHHAGTKPITLVLQHKEKGVWVTKRKVAARIISDGRYAATRIPLYAGSWRVRAEHHHPTKVSWYRYFTAH